MPPSLIECESAADGEAWALAVAALGDAEELCVTEGREVGVVEEDSEGEFVEEGQPEVEPDAEMEAVEQGLEEGESERRSDPEEEGLAEGEGVGRGDLEGEGLIEGEAVRRVEPVPAPLLKLSAEDAVLLPLREGASAEGLGVCEGLCTNEFEREGEEVAERDTRGELLDCGERVLSPPLPLPALRLAVGAVDPEGSSDVVGAKLPVATRAREGETLAVPDNEKDALLVAGAVPEAYTEGLAPPTREADAAAALGVAASFSDALASADEVKEAEGEVEALLGMSLPLGTALALPPPPPAPWALAEAAAGVRDGVPVAAALEDEALAEAVGGAAEALGLLPPMGEPVATNEAVGGKEEVGGTDQEALAEEEELCEAQREVEDVTVTVPASGLPVPRSASEAEAAAEGEAKAVREAATVGEGYLLSVRDELGVGVKVAATGVRQGDAEAEVQSDAEGVPLGEPLADPLIALVGDAALEGEVLAQAVTLREFAPPLRPPSDGDGDIDAARRGEGVGAALRLGARCEGEPLPVALPLPLTDGDADGDGDSDAEAVTQALIDGESLLCKEPLPGAPLLALGVKQLLPLNATSDCVAAAESEAAAGEGVLWSPLAEASAVGVLDSDTEGVTVCEREGEAVAQVEGETAAERVAPTAAAPAVPLAQPEGEVEKDTDGEALAEGELEGSAVSVPPPSGCGGGEAVGLTLSTTVGVATGEAVEAAAGEAESGEAEPRPLGELSPLGEGCCAVRVAPLGAEGVGAAALGLKDAEGVPPPPPLALTLSVLLLLAHPLAVSEGLPEAEGSKDADSGALGEVK